jgi:hypothetical protein
MGVRFTIEDLAKKGIDQNGNRIEKSEKEKPSYNKYKNQRDKQTGHHSNSEKGFAQRLKLLGFDFKEKEKFELIPGFEYMGEKILPIRIEPDFTIYKQEKLIAIVDTKHITGYPKKKDGSKGKPKIGTEDWRNKIKILKFTMKDNPVKMFFPVTKSEKEQVILELLTLVK